MAKNRFIPFSRPWIDDTEIEAVSQVLASKWISTGNRTREFERAFAEYLGVKHAIAVSSCTAALHLSLVVAGVSSGDEVITTPYTFTATAEAIRYVGAKPVFVDIQPDTLNIDVTQIEQAITRRTKAIMPVHFAGLPVIWTPYRTSAKATTSHSLTTLPTLFRLNTKGSTSATSATYLLLVSMQIKISRQVRVV